MQVPTLQEIVCSESDCSFEKGFLLSSPNEVKKSNNCCDDAMVLKTYLFHFYFYYVISVV